MRRTMAGRTGRGERGLTLVEVIAAMAIGSLVLSTIYLALGTAIKARLLVWSQVHNQQHGRLVIQWMADRLRQAGYAVSPASPLPRCQDALVAEDPALRPTASQIYFNTDLDGAGAGAPTQTIGFRVGRESAGGTMVNVVEESVADCTSGAPSRVSSVTDPTSVAIASLTFDYYDASGTPVTDLATPDSIRTIRMVRITLVEQASAGSLGPRGQTWSVLVSLRNPDPRNP
ncbi:MAG: prepilin-type N-terminal cleavage/methylation domain-containing protein [Armatimonadota bacterium]|nr:prepilin-type N-terminal cleavage/methylation domain-containing protein [Armatimonadota bacterium]